MGFDLEDMAASRTATPKLKRNTPLSPADCVVIGTLWVLREIEMAWAAFGDVTVDEGKQHICWFLPVSKVGARATACTRTLGCLCGTDHTVLCPYHVVCEYRAKVQAFFHDTDLHLTDETPFFPDFTGGVVRKVNIVNALGDNLSRRSCPIADRSGRRLFGGHSCRVTGSRYWVSQGLEVFKLQVFARWGFGCHTPVCCRRPAGKHDPRPAG